jgi:hypothetical protein
MRRLIPSASAAVLSDNPVPPDSPQPVLIQEIQDLKHGSVSANLWRRNPSGHLVSDI